MEKAKLKQRCPSTSSKGILLAHWYVTTTTEQAPRPNEHIFDTAMVPPLVTVLKALNMMQRGSNGVALAKQTRKNWWMLRVETYLLFDVQNSWLKYWHAKCANMLNESLEPMQLVQHVAPFAYSTLVVTSLQIETVCSGSSWIFLSSILLLRDSDLHQTTPSICLFFFPLWGRADKAGHINKRHKSFQETAMEF